MDLRHGHGDVFHFLASASPSFVVVVVPLEGDAGDLDAGHGHLHGDGDGHQDALDAQEQLLAPGVPVLLEHVVDQLLHAVHLPHAQHRGQQDVGVQQGGRESGEDARRSVDVQLLRKGKRKNTVSKEKK